MKESKLIDKIMIAITMVAITIAFVSAIVAHYQGLFNL
jgi:hypothetical protein